MTHRFLKKCAAFLLVCVMMLTMVNVGAWAVSPFAGGDGTPGQPYKIATSQQLYEVRNYLDSCFIQIANITIDPAIYPDWSPIGTLGSPFTGSFDGGDFSISNLIIDTTESSTEKTVLGLFGVIGVGASLSGINLENARIDVARGTNTMYQTFIGGLAAANLGTISNCSVTGIINADCWEVAAGGLVGNNGGFGPTYGPGVITGSTSNCTLDIVVNYQVAHAGGLAGQTFTAGSEITNSTSSGSVTCRGGSDTYQTGPYAGGLIGYASDTEIDNCQSDALVSAENARSQAIAGGLIGGIVGNCIISNCHSSGDVTASDSATSISSYGTDVRAGGLIGYSFSSSTILDCYSTGNASGIGTGASGIFAYVFSGGFLGSASAGTSAVNILRSYATGEGTATVNTNGQAFAGGFGGYYTKVDVKNSYSTGHAQAVAAAGYACAGGFTGYFYGANAVTSSSTITNCFSTGNAVANCPDNERSGGLSGVVQNSAVAYSYSTGIPGVSHDAFLSKCGGLVGVTNVGTISHSYYDSTISGKTDSDRGTPMATADMKMVSFISALSNAGADWKLVSNLNSSYPLIDGVGLGALPTALITYKDSADTSTTYGADTVEQGRVFAQPSSVSPVKAGSSLTGWYTDPACDSGSKWNFATHTVSDGAQTLYAGWAALPDTTVPTVADKTIRVDAVSQTGVTLSWNKAADDTSTQTALQYLVYWSGSNNLGSVASIEANGAPVGSYAPDLNTKDVTGLLAGTTYYFNVIVKDEAGNKTCYTAKSAATTPFALTAAYDTNLAANGNAEASDTVMAGWNASGVAFEVRTPGEGIAPPSSSNGGNVFHYSPGAAAGEYLYQVIDISNLASDIALGLVNVQFSAQARKYMSGSDVSIRLEMLDETSHVLNTFNESLNSGDSNFAWSMLSISQKAIHADARKLRITLAASIGSGNPAGDFAQFDGVSLILTRTPILNAGAVNRTGDANATVVFGTDKAGFYYYGIVEDGAVEPAIDTSAAGIACAAGQSVINLTALTQGEKDIYIKVKDSAGNVSASLKMDIPAYAAADMIAPVLSLGTANRQSDTTAEITFVSDEAGVYYFTVVEDGAGEPAIDTGAAGATCVAGQNTISLTALSHGAKDIYIKVKDAAGNVSSVLKIDIPEAFIPVTGIAGVPAAASAGTDLVLTGTVAPAEATNQTIVWSVKNAGTTEASIVGNTLSTKAAGTVTITATIANGASISTAFTQDFTIPVYAMIPNTLEEQVDSVVVAAEGIFAQEARLVVMPIAEGAAEREALEQQLSDQNVIASYEVHVEPADAFTPPLSLSFHIGEKYNGKTIYILHKLSDGSTDIYTPTVVKGEVIITVNELSPFLLAIDPAVIIAEQPQSVTALLGTTATFSVKAEGLEPFTYKWQRRTSTNGTWNDIDGATGPSYTTTTLNMSHNGYAYRVIVTDILNNSATSNVAVLMVTKSPATGDTSHPVAYAMLILLLAAAATLLLRKRRQA